MNRFRRSKEWFSLWLIIVMLGHFGLSPSDASAWVLCIGADGHVAVEPADHHHRPPANTDEWSPPSDGAFVQVLKAGESACLDLPVVSKDHGAHVLLSGMQKLSLDEGFTATTVLLNIAFSLFPQGIAKLVFPPAPPIVDSRLVALRSVVLLI